MFLSCHVRILELIYTLQLLYCQGTPCLKKKQYVSGSNGIRNLVKWLNFHLRTEWLWVQISEYKK